MKKLLLKAGITIGVLAVLFTQLEAKPILDALKSAAWLGLGLAIAQLFLQPWIAALKWKLLLDSLEAPSSFARVFEANYIGVFFSQVLPSTIGGDGLRIYYAHQDGAPLRAAVSSVGLDRFSILVALLGFNAAALPWLSERLDVNLSWATGFVAAGAVGAVLLLWLADRFPETWRRHKPLDLLARLGEDFRRSLLHPFRGLAQLALSVLSVFSLVLTAYLIGRAMGLNAGLGDMLIVMPAVIFASSLPLSISGWGTREAATVVLLSSAEIPQAEAFALSALFGLCGLAVALPGSIFYLFRRRRLGSAALPPSEDSPESTA